MKKSAGADQFLNSNAAHLRGRFCQGADGTSRETKLHAANTLCLQINRKCPACVALGMTDFVTGLGSPAGKLADATHRC